MTLAPSLRMQVKRLKKEFDMDEGGPVDHARTLRLAIERWEAMTPAERQAERLADVQRARDFVAAIDPTNEPSDWTYAGRALGRCRGTLRVHAMNERCIASLSEPDADPASQDAMRQAWQRPRGRRLLAEGMADSSSASTSAGATRNAMAITSPPPIPTYDEGNP